MGALAKVLAAHAKTTPGKLPEPAGTGASDPLEERLRALWEAGRAAWPKVDIPAETFVRHLAERLPEERSLPEALARLHAADLYLACGCTLGNVAAIADFDAHYIAEVSNYLRHRESLPGFADEIKQTLRARLLVADNPLLPRISQYTGQGALGLWLRIATTWAALDMDRARRRQQGRVDEQDIASTTADPELQYLRNRYAGELRQALAATLDSMDAHDATILRLFFLQGMRAEDIAKIYQVVPRTVRLWINSARNKILEETRRRLGSRLGLPEGEAASLLRLLKQDLDTSILHVLSAAKE